MMEKNDGDLARALLSHGRTGAYPFHMPGHKRRGVFWQEDFAGLFDPSALDITEIEGFDNLHDARGILRDAEERAAGIYGSSRCHFLVNGSTCGVLAAISAATKRGDKVVVARNCHKSVYHALFLRELEPAYVYPAITPMGIQGGVRPEQIKGALDKNPGASAVVITSPTYEGIISDVAAIADVAHERGIPLIVDGAHGAHLGFGGGFPEGAVRHGADAVVMSLHKTLPSLTQTALLHVGGNLISDEAVRTYLSVYETSSPSYLLMASMDSCIRRLESEGRQLFSRYRERLGRFYENAKKLRFLRVMSRDDIVKAGAFDWDDSKISIFGMDGAKLRRELLARYKLQMEMAAPSYALAMTSIMDTDEGFERLGSALGEIDRELAGSGAGMELAGRGADIERAEQRAEMECSERKGLSVIARETGAAGEPWPPCENGETGGIAALYAPRTRLMQIHEALSAPAREVAFQDAEGMASGCYVCLYPPGIPMLVPGEEITSSFLKGLRMCKSRGYEVEGADLTRERISVVE